MPWRGLSSPSIASSTRFRAPGCGAPPARDPVGELSRGELDAQATSCCWAPSGGRAHAPRLALGGEACARGSAHSRIAASAPWQPPAASAVPASPSRRAGPSGSSVRPRREGAPPPGRFAVVDASACALCSPSHRHSLPERVAPHRSSPVRRRGRRSGRGSRNGFANAAAARRDHGGEALARRSIAAGDHAPAHEGRRGRRAERGMSSRHQQARAQLRGSRRPRRESTCRHEQRGARDPITGRPHIVRAIGSPRDPTPQSHDDGAHHRAAPMAPTMVRTETSRVGSRSSANSALAGHGGRRPVRVRHGKCSARTSRGRNATTTTRR